MQTLVTQYRTTSNSYAPQLVLVGITALFGLSNVVQIALLKEIDPWLALGLRSGLAVLCLLPFAAIELCRIWLDRRAVFKAMPIAVASFSLGMCFQMTGASMTSATNLGFIINLGVVFTPLLCRFLGHGRLGRPTCFAILLSLTGVALLSIGSPTGLGLGDALCLCAALCYSVWIIAVQRIGSKHNCLVLMTTLQWIAPAIAGFSISQSGFDALSQLSSSCWLYLLYVGCAASAFGFLVAAKAQTKMSATHAAVIYPAEAVFGAIAAVFWLGETLSPLASFGACLTLVSIAIVSLPAGSFRFTTLTWRIA